ncbi:MAG: hypothetical protein JSV76_00935 [Candidatus Bathyarchaeota archaeon]|nr:MAG: hypothetical protein JSV76_00935 [Candidatus Bathyarchaeota archaeon]
MPVHTVFLDSFHKEEDITILLGKKTVLKLTEEKSTQDLLNNKLVQRFITSTNLCNDTITSLIDELLSLDQLFHSPIVLFEKKKYAETQLVHSRISMGNFTIEKNHIDPAQSPGYGNTSIKTSIRRLQKEDRDLLQTYTERIRTLDNQLQSMIGVSIVIEAQLFICPHCNIIHEDITRKICSHCHNDIYRSQVETLPIVKIHDTIRTIWTSGTWLNAFMAKLLRKLGWDTWVNIQVLGPSGISRKVSILAVKNSTILLGEAHPDTVSRKKVLNVLSNSTDLNIQVTLLATTKTIALSESEKRKYFLPNPFIIHIETMGQSDETQILRELERRLMRILKYKNRPSSYIG